MEIQAVQPHRSGYESLWWLHELVNTDKHRMPLLTIGVADPLQKTVSFSDSMSGQFEAMTPPGGVFPLILNRRYPFAPTVEMNGQLTGFVAFQDVSMPREPVDWTLEQIIETVANVILRFDRFF